MIIEEALVGQPRYMSRSDNGVRDCPELFHADMVPRLSQRIKLNIRRRKEGAALSIFIIPNRPKYTNAVKHSLRRKIIDRLLLANTLFLSKMISYRSHARLHDSAAIAFL
ncbi:hypothetical protein B9Z19DRAFT_1101486 [Tuber borchii]|uniref:Uncharacterized protein n=1 Tax=Tuber borchii TaxID=42251 RepID=A0A2T6ZRM0_TUBBO|nr:hypothetical protein B9Z19DRAFT_1101486 [Tuber borchii]